MGAATTKGTHIALFDKLESLVYDIICIQQGCVANKAAGMKVRNTVTPVVHLSLSPHSLLHIPTCMYLLFLSFIYMYVYSILFYSYTHTCTYP